MELSHGAAATEVLAHPWGPELGGPAEAGARSFNLSLATGSPCKVAVFGPGGSFHLTAVPRGLAESSWLSVLQQLGNEGFSP